MACHYRDAAIDFMGHIVGIGRPAAADQREVGLNRNEGKLDLRDNAVSRVANCFELRREWENWL